MGINERLALTVVNESIGCRGGYDTASVQKGNPPHEATEKQETRDAVKL
jgi:hypothetical protein